MANGNPDPSRILQAGTRRLAEDIVTRWLEKRMPSRGLSGEGGRGEAIENNIFYLQHLAQAVASGQPALFADCVAWAKARLSSLGVPPEALLTDLECMRQVLHEALPDSAKEPVLACIDAALQAAPDQGGAHGTPEEERLPERAAEYLEALLRWDRGAATRVVLDAVAAGASVKEIYLQIFQKAQEEIGRLWQSNRVTVAQEHFCTACTQHIMSQLYPSILSTEKTGRSAVVTCVSGDLHEIGARMVADVFEMEGWDAFYLGANAPHDSVVETVRARRPHVLAVSVTLTPHVQAAECLISLVRASEDCGQIRIIVGGRAFNVVPGLWKTVQADGTARDCASAVYLANALISKGMSA